MTTEAKLPVSPVEIIKQRSDFLRGTIVQGLADTHTGALAEDDTQLSKFHGFYQQDDRDLRNERTRQKLEPAYSFMIRVRVPGGIATPQQWLAMDRLARSHANGTLRLTTRQAFQFHGVIKARLKETIRGINDSLLDTIAACGDVNRNVMCTPLDERSNVHAAACAVAKDISEKLTPHTTAYHEIWLDGKKVTGQADSEPLYGPTYLPRKFKIGVVIPPSNDVDVLSQDLGFIAIEKDGELAGFNVTAGGGMGITHGDDRTYPRVADVIGFCAVAQAVDVAEKVVALQRDNGDRTNRKHARLKYTIDDRGLDWFRAELQERLGYVLPPPRPYAFTSRGDEFGWTTDRNGEVHLTLFVPEGRLKNDGPRFLSGVAEIARVHRGDFRLTPNQNLIISRIAPDTRPAIVRLLKEYGIADAQKVSPLRQQALACVAMPTCALAMAEAERFLPELTQRIDALLDDHGLGSEAISLRITGCPNGCARPYLAEIALVGKAPGRYNLFLGGSADGLRLNRLHAENIDVQQIFAVLARHFAAFGLHRRSGERFGDFVARAAAPEVAS
jgi:sulfite reductase (NADPH) hemoprotein beta-component